LFDPAVAGELNIVRDGLFTPSFTLTDGVNHFGELSYAGNWRRVGLVETNQKSWTIAFGKLFSRDLLINETLTGETIAVVKTSLWRGRVSVEFTDGQRFFFIREGIFSGKQCWYSEQYGNVVSIKSRPFGYKRPFTVNFEQGPYHYSNYLLLLTFLSVHLILIRRRRAAASIH